MSEEYDKADCKDRHEKIDKQLEKLESRMNYFYLLAVGTLVAMVMNFMKGL
jgi:hypothetical protein